nr:PREDICTED: protein AHNAK2 [Latimeria chalumnae]|eukprot:XP_014340474.1 PREDICTED: protein AHNAK2 [Latimeria chalumnae]
MEKENMEVIMKTEAEAGASGFSIRGGGKEGVFVKHLIKDSPAAKSLSMREGDQLLSATIFFDNVKYEDAVKILQYSEPYRMQFCFKRNLSEAEEMETTESSLPHQMEHESMKSEEATSKLPASFKFPFHISGETGKKQETDKSPVKKRNQKTDRTDARISWPKFQPFKSVKMSRFKRSYSTSEAEEQDKSDILLIDTEGEAPHQNEEMQEKIRKKQKLKFPHIGILSYKAKTEIIQEPEPFQTNKDTTREIKAEIKRPEVEISHQKTDLRKTDTSIKFPEFKMSIPFKKTQSETPHEKDIDILTNESIEVQFHQEADTRKTALDEDIQIHEAQIKGFEQQTEEEGRKLKKPKIKMPSIGFSTPDIKSPKLDVDVSAPEAGIVLPKPEAEVKGPDVKIAKPTVDIEVKGGEVETKGLGTKLHMPKMKMPSFGLSRPEMKAGEGDFTDVPSVEVDVKSKGAKPDIDVPSVDIDIERTKVDIEGSEGKIEKPRMKMPKFDISLPKVIGPDISLSMHKADIDISLPEGKIEGEGPDVNIEIPKVEAEIKGLDQQAEDIGGKLKKPKIKMPSIGFSTSEIKVPKFDVGVSAPEAGIALPKPEAEMKGPDFKVEKPTVDIEVKGGEVETKGLGTKLHMPNIKIPSFGQSRPEMRAGEGHLDVSITKPKVEISSGKGEVKVTAPKTDIQAPSLDVDIDTEEVEVEGPEGMITMPRFHLPKFGMSLPTLKGPKIEVNKKEKEADISFPTGEVDIKVPDMSVTLPESEANVSIPESEMQGIGKKIKMPKLKMPKFGFSKREVKMPKLDVDLAFPTVDTSLPKTDVDIKGREIKGGEPEIDVQIAKPKTDVPFIEIGVKTKGAKPDIDLPSVDIDIESTKVEIEGSEGKIEMPRMKMPKFDISLPKVKGPDISLSMHKADIDISLPEGKIEGEGPDVNIEIPNVEAEIMGLDQQEEDIGGKLKKPKIKMPSIGFSTPEIKAPKLDVDVSASEAEIALPKPEAEIKVPDVKIEKPTVDIEIKGGEVETDGLGTKLHMPKIKMPSFGLRRPEVKAGEGNLDVSITKPEVEISSSKGEIEVTVPKTDVQAPSLEVDIDTEKVEVDVPEGNIKMPSFHLPKFGMSLPSLKEPKIDFSKKEIEADISFLKGEVDVKGTDRSVTLPDAMAVVNIPESEMQGTGKKLKMPKLKIPKFGFSKPEVKMPKLDVDVTVPTIEMSLPKSDIEIKGRKLKAGEPEIDVQIAQPHIDVPSFEVDVITKGSKTGIEAPSVDIDLDNSEIEIIGPEGKIEMPETEMPKIDISSPSKKCSDIIVSGPYLGSEFSLSKGKVESEGRNLVISSAVTKTAVEVSEVEIKETGGKFKFPKIKLPQFRISVPEFSDPTLDIDISLPNVGVSLSKDEDMKFPDVNLEDLNVDPENELKGYLIQECEEVVPKIKATSSTKPQVDSPSTTGDVHVIGPETGQEPSPDVQADTTKVEGAVPFEKTKFPKFKLPKFGLSLPKFKGSDAVTSIQKSDTETSLPKTKRDIVASEMGITIHAADANYKKASDSRPQETENISKIEMPKCALTTPQVKTPKVEFDATMPTVGISLEKTDIDLKGTESKTGYSDNIMQPSCSKEDSLAAEVDTDITDPDAAIKGLSSDVDFESRVVDIEELEAKIKMSKMKRFTVPDPNVKGQDISMNLPEKDIDISLPRANLGTEHPHSSLQAEKNKAECDIHKLETEGPKGKFKIPKLKFPVFRISLPEVKDSTLDIDVNLPAVGISLAKAEGDIKAQEIKPKPAMESEIKIGVDEMERQKSNLNTFKQKTLTINLSGPKTKTDEAGTDISPTEPKPNVPSAKIGVQIKGPETDIQAPLLDINTDTTEAEVKDLGGKVKKPKFKLPNFGISLSKFRGSDTGTIVPKEHTDVSLLKPEGDTELPDGSGKISEKEKQAVGGIPKIAMPKFRLSTPEVKAPKLGADINLPRADMSFPKSDIGVKGFELTGDTNSDIQLSKPKVDIPSAEVDFEITASDVALTVPLVDFKTKCTELEVEGKEGQTQVPAVKLSTFDVSPPKVKDPGVSLTIPKTDLAISVPMAKGDSEEHGKEEFQLQEVEATGTGGMFKIPKIKMPVFGISASEIKDPMLDMNVSLPTVGISVPKAKEDVRASDVKIKSLTLEDEVKLSGIKMEKQEGKLIMPKSKQINVPLPKVKGPSFLLSIPKKEVDDRSLPTANVDSKGHAINIEADTTRTEFEVSKVDKEETGGIFKLPKIKMPVFGIATSEIKDPMLDVDVSLPTVGISLPKAKEDIKASEVKLEAPTLEDKIKQEGVEMERHEGKLRIPKLKVPKFGITGPKVKADGDIDIITTKPNLVPSVKEEVRVKVPETDIQASLLDVHIDKTEVDVEGPDGNKKKSKFKLPEFGMSLPEVKDTEITLPKQDTDVSLPKTERDLKVPEMRKSFPDQDAGIRMPAVNVDLECTEEELEVPDASKLEPVYHGEKTSSDKDRSPTFGFSLLKVKVPEAGIMFDKTDTHESVMAAENDVLKEAKEQTSKSKELGLDNVTPKISVNENQLTRELKFDHKDTSEAVLSNVNVPRLKTFTFEIKSPESVNESSKLNASDFTQTSQPAVSSSVLVKESLSKMKIKDESKIPEKESPKAKQSSGKFRFSFPKIGFSTSTEDSVVKPIEEAKTINPGQAQSPALLAKDVCPTKEKTGWFSFPKIGFSSRSKKENLNIDIENHSKPQELILQKEITEECYIDKDLIKHPFEGMKPSVLPQEGSKITVDPTVLFPSEQESPFPRKIAERCLEEEVAVTTCDVRLPHTIVTSSARTEMILLEPGEMNVPAMLLKHKQPESISGVITSSERQSGRIASDTKAGDEEIAPDVKNQISSFSAHKGLLSSDHSKDSADIQTNAKPMVPEALGYTESSLPSFSLSTSNKTFTVSTEEERAASLEKHVVKQALREEKQTVVFIKRAAQAQESNTESAESPEVASDALKKIKETMYSERKKFFEASQPAPVVPVRLSKRREPKENVTSKDE